MAINQMNPLPLGGGRVNRYLLVSGRKTHCGHLGRKPWGASRKQAAKEADARPSRQPNKGQARPSKRRQVTQREERETNSQLAQEKAPSLAIRTAAGTTAVETPRNFERIAQVIESIASIAEGISLADAVDLLGELDRRAGALESLKQTFERPWLRDNLAKIKQGRGLVSAFVEFRRTIEVTQ